MLEIFHSTNHLSSVSREGIKSPYQMATEGKGCQHLSLGQMDSAQISETTRFLCRCVFFFDESPVMDDWVSILVDENDTSVKVGNMSLVETCYGDGILYPKSVMPLPTFLKRRKSKPKPGQDYENPLTARLMTYDQMEKFRRKFEQVMGDELVFEYRPEIVVQRLVIPTSEFHRTSLTG
jgi:hypothetical protein